MIMSNIRELNLDHSCQVRPTLLDKYFDKVEVQRLIYQ
jgi:hypothetical protein